jgi:hypothetical protein
MEDLLLTNDKTLGQNYEDLLRQARQIDLAEEQGIIGCTRCRKKKKDHLHDGRCSSSALSGEYTSEVAGLRAKVEKALRLIEELQEL